MVLRVFRDGKHLNYVRLFDGQCHNCSTYKCTTHKANMGGAEWCIMLFPDALAHCDSDPNCGGYTMTTADWFHKQYDKNGQVAVHLTKAGEKPFNCSFSEWSSYEKLTTIRDTPVTYGKTTCPERSVHRISLSVASFISYVIRSQQTSDKSSNFNYVFDSSSNTVSGSTVYECKDHPEHLNAEGVSCILSIGNGINYCNSDALCEGFVVNTDETWQKKYSKNGMQAVQLVGRGATYTPDATCRSFKKQQ